MSVILTIGSMILLGFAVLQFVIAVVSILGAMLILPLMPLLIAVETWLKVTK